MNTTTPALRRYYDMHGVGVELNADDDAVLDAMELRLRGFRRAALPHPGTVRFEFRSEEPTLAEIPGRSALGRPVYDTPHGSLYYLSEPDMLWGRLGGVHLRCEAGRGVTRLQAARFSGRELYLATHPLSTVSMMELMERRGLFSLHAACLATTDSRGVLLAGASGSGKSTLALALARAGMEFLADDVVFIAPGNASSPLRAYGFADAVGLTDASVQHFPELRSLLEEPPADGFHKHLVRIEDLFGVPAPAACVPRALVFSYVAPDEPSAITPLDGGEALLRLVPDVLLTEPAATEAHLGAIAALLAQVECYTLRSGVDLERAGELVQNLL
jgi:hypothetical protein